MFRVGTDHRDLVFSDIDGVDRTLFVKENCVVKIRIPLPDGGMIVIRNQGIQFVFEHYILHAAAHRAVGAD